MERWREITGYEGLYEASNYGNIRTCKGKITSSAKCNKRIWKQRVLKGRGNNPITGKRVSLWKDGKVKDWLVARLVAMTWVDGYSEKLTVNHKNGNRLDNKFENLEWLTLADNIRHGFETGLYSTQIPVTITNKVTNETMSFNSMSKAAKHIGKSPGYISELFKKNYFEDDLYIYKKEKQI